MLFSMRPIIVLLVAILVVLQYKLLLGSSGFLQLKRLETKLAHQQSENKTLTARNQAMEAEIAELKSGNQALEEQARYELGMIRNNETYYHFVEQAKE